MRKVRPTFLLRCVVLASSVGLFLLVLMLASSALTVGTVLFLLAFWYLGIEEDFLPLLLEHVLAKRAQRSVGGGDSLWYVDVEKERKRAVDDHARGTSDNPTIR